jgi:hypothetical protein
MATHIVIVHEIPLADGGPREQAQLLARIEAPLAALEAELIKVGGTTKVEAPHRKGPGTRRIKPIDPQVEEDAPWEVPQHRTRQTAA